MVTLTAVNILILSGFFFVPWLEVLNDKDDVQAVLQGKWVPQFPNSNKMNSNTRYMLTITLRKFVELPSS